MCVLPVGLQRAPSSEGNPRVHHTVPIKSNVDSSPIFYWEKLEGSLTVVSITNDLSGLCGSFGFSGLWRMPLNLPSGTRVVVDENLPTCE